MSHVFNDGEYREDLSSGSGRFQPTPGRAAIHSAGRPDGPKPPSLPTRKQVFDLQGEAQINSGGIARQDELLRCEPGEAVFLRPVPDEGSAGPGFDVLSARGVAIGSLRAEDAEALASALLSRRFHRAKLHALRGGLPGYPLYGARISVAWDERPDHPHILLDGDQAHERRRRLQAKAAPRRRGRRAIGSGLFGKKAGASKRIGPYLAVAAVLGGLAVLGIAFLFLRWFGGWWCWACAG